MKDRIFPCIYYTWHNGICEKGFKNVTLAKCKNCPKYRPRSGKKPENIKMRRQKDRDRHDNWKQY